MSDIYTFRLQNHIHSKLFWLETKGEYIIEVSLMYNFVNKLEVKFVFLVLVFGIYLDTNFLLRKWSREKFTKLNARLCQTSLLSLFFNNLLLKGVDVIVPTFLPLYICSLNM